MKKVFKEKDSWGEYVIYVSLCEKYKYEDYDIAPMKPKDVM